METADSGWFVGKGSGRCFGETVLRSLHREQNGIGMGQVDVEPACEKLLLPVMVVSQSVCPAIENKCTRRRTILRRQRKTDAAKKKNQSYPLHFLIKNTPSMKKMLVLLIFILPFLSSCNKQVPENLMKKTEVDRTAGGQSKISTGMTTFDVVPPSSQYQVPPWPYMNQTAAGAYSPPSPTNFPLDWEATYDPRGIIIVMKAGVVVGSSQGSITWGYSTQFPAQIIITGGALGNMINPHAIWTVQKPSVGFSTYVGQAQEQRVIVYTTDGSSTIKAGTTQQFPIGGTFSNGYKITQTVNSITDYNMVYRITFYTGTFDPDLAGATLMFSYNNSNSNITGVPVN